MKQSIALCVASKNPVKVAAGEKSVMAAFPDSTVATASIAAPSGVPEQPMSAQETYDGAVNRVKYCQQTVDADLYISFEGGVDLVDGIPSTYAVVCIADKQTLRTGRTGNLPLPDCIYQALLDGGELGPEMDKLYATQNIKHKGGAIGQLTSGLYTRESIYIAAAVLTLAPFRYPSMFAQSMGSR